MRRIKHKKLVVVISIFVVLALASAAFAYWTSSGTGSGSATAGSAGSYDVTVSVADGIHPAGGVAVTGTITNNTTSALQVHTISADTTTYTHGVQFDAPHSGCAAADFHFTGTVTGGTQTLAAGGGSTGYTGTLSMDETPLVNQDSCQGATITLHLVAA